MFTRPDVRWLSETTLALYAAQSVAQIAVVGMAAVRQRFTVIASTCEEVSYDNTRYVIHALHSETQIPADYAAFIHDNPGGPLIASGAIRTTMQLRKSFRSKLGSAPIITTGSPARSAMATNCSPSPRIRGDFSRSGFTATVSFQRGNIV